jgi:L-asparaginase/Glu-tRNA(Gln) amidotransferase subunit D
MMSGISLPSGRTSFSGNQAKFGNSSTTQPVKPFPQVETEIFRKRTLYLGTTGGTIDMIKNADGTRMPSMGTGSMMAKMIATSSPEYRVQHFNLFDRPTDSSSIDRQEQGRFLKTIVERIKKDPSAAMVITHGTDTLMETAALLAYQRFPIPIVLTGAWASPKEPASDAKNNLLRAKELALRLRTPGVFVAIGRHIHLGSRIQKIRTSPFQVFDQNLSSLNEKGQVFQHQGKHSYFASVDNQPVGYFVQKQPAFYPKVARDGQQHDPVHPSFDVLEVNALKPKEPAYVEHLLVNSNLSPFAFTQMIRRLREQQKPCGAVLEGELSHHPYFHKLSKIIQKLSKEKIYIVTTGHHGPTLPLNINTIPPMHLRAKMAALLPSIKQTSDFLPSLRANLAGEVTGQISAKNSHFHIPGFQPTTDAVIVATPSLNAAEIRDAITRLYKPIVSQQQENPYRLIIVGYGDGHLPIGIQTLKDRLTRKGPDQRFLWQLVMESIEGEAQAKSQASRKTVEPNYSIPSILNHLEQLYSIDRNLSRRLLREKLPYSVPNLRAYEIGTILRLLGVKPI